MVVIDDPLKDFFYKVLENEKEEKIIESIWDKDTNFEEVLSKLLKSF